MNTAIKKIADREFNGAEFLVGFKQGNFCIASSCKAKDIKENMNKTKEVFKKTPYQR